MDDGSTSNPPPATPSVTVMAPATPQPASTPSTASSAQPSTTVTVTTPSPPTPGSSLPFAPPSPTMTVEMTPNSAATPASAPPPSAPPVALREDHVRNAVNFLAHPNVKGSPVKYRRSFLESKGLTADEIDEAFRRVPDPPSGNGTASVSVTTPAATTASAQSGVQEAAPSQPGVQQGVTITPFAVQQPGGQVAPGGGVVVQTGQMAPGQQMQAAATSGGRRWAQMALAMGVIGAGGAGAAMLAQNFVAPRVRQWMAQRSAKSLPAKKAKRSKKKPKPPQSLEEGGMPTASSLETEEEEDVEEDVEGEEDEEEEEEEEGKGGKKGKKAVSAAITSAAAIAAAAAAKELLQARMTEDKSTSQALLKAMEAQTAELRTALGYLQQAAQSQQKVSAATQQPAALTMGDLRKELQDLASSLGSPAPSSTAASANGLSFQTPSLQQQQQQSAQTYPLQQMQATLSVPVTVPVTTPSGSLGQQYGNEQQQQQQPHQQQQLETQQYWQQMQQQRRQAAPWHPQPQEQAQQQGQGSAMTAVNRSTTNGYAPSAPDEAPHSKSYMEVLEMVKRGERPPNVQDIDDSPPDPTRPLSDARMRPRSKPWEQSAPPSRPSSSGSYRSGYTSPSHTQAPSDAPFWQRKAAPPAPSVSTSLPFTPSSSSPSYHSVPSNSDASSYLNSYPNFNPSPNMNDNGNTGAGTTTVNSTNLTTINTTNTAFSGAPVYSSPTISGPSYAYPTPAGTGPGSSGLPLPGAPSSSTSSFHPAMSVYAKPFVPLNAAPPSGVMITEMPAGNGTGNVAQAPGSIANGGSQDRNGSTEMKPGVSTPSRSWVPPAVPSTVLPGAAAAIRPKPPSSYMGLGLSETDTSSNHSAQGSGSGTPANGVTTGGYVQSRQSHGEAGGLQYEAPQQQNQQQNQQPQQQQQQNLQQGYSKWETDERVGGKLQGLQSQQEYNPQQEENSQQQQFEQQQQLQQQQQQQQSEEQQRKQHAFVQEQHQQQRHQQQQQHQQQQEQHHDDQDEHLPISTSYHDPSAANSAAPHGPFVGSPLRSSPGDVQRSSEKASSASAHEPIAVTDILAGADNPDNVGHMVA
eukprot:TRINITY_DN1099_c1_g1_i2.p1 TRINITY_DN1099_c1_g1~~TRINITY_DN1099_c1_g1_i2.p1  ORF type:complete len:1081 (+),score=340.67 TRINITY_DN1099_c1_g1_i2:235-3477(+)